MEIWFIARRVRELGGENWRLSLCNVDGNTQKAMVLSGPWKRILNWLREREGGNNWQLSQKNLHVVKHQKKKRLKKKEFEFLYQECVISSRFVIFDKIFHFCYFLCVLSLLISFMLLFCVRYVLIIFILTTVSASMNASAVKNLLRTPC